MVPLRALLPATLPRSGYEPCRCGRGDETREHSSGLPRFHWLPAALPWSPGQQFTADHRAEGASERKSQTVCDLYSPELKQGSILRSRLLSY